jgi:hypothetical protein
MKMYKINLNSFEAMSQFLNDSLFITYNKLKAFSISKYKSYSFSKKKKKDLIEGKRKERN